MHSIKYKTIEFLFLVYAKYSWVKYVFGILLYPYFMASMILSINRAPSHMGGIQKWFLRASLFLPSIYMKVFNKRLKSKGLTLYQVFYGYYSTYNPTPDHHLTVKESRGFIDQN